MEDRAVLQELYRALGGSQWKNSFACRSQKGWKDSKSPTSKYYGVKVDGDGRVVSLKLASQVFKVGLRGVIPPQLGSLEALKELNLSNNDLSGLIPPELGHLSLLERCDLSLNDLVGAVPESMADLTLLRFVSFFGNNIHDNPVTLPDRREVKRWQDRLRQYWEQKRHLAKLLAQANQDGFSSHPAIVAKAALR